MTTPPKRPTKQAIEEAKTLLINRKNMTYSESVRIFGYASAISQAYIDRLASVVAWLEAAERETER